MFVKKKNQNFQISFPVWVFFFMSSATVYSAEIPVEQKNFPFESRRPHSRNSQVDHSNVIFSSTQFWLIRMNFDLITNWTEGIRFGEFECKKSSSFKLGLSHFTPEI